MSDDSKNLSRVEDLLNNDPYLPKTPMSRVEKLLEDGILPKVTPADNGKILKVKDGEWETGEDISGDKLPPVSSADNGKVLKVVDSEWNIGEDEGDRLPFVTGADEGKVLKVNDQGHWEAGTDEGGVEAVELTQNQYDELSTAEKEDPTKVYFINTGTPILDPQYEYHTNQDETLIYRCKVSDGSEGVWFLNGFEVTSLTNAAIPIELRPYAPTGDGKVSDAWRDTNGTPFLAGGKQCYAGIYNNTVRIWSNNGSTNLLGTVYAVIDMRLGNRQYNEWSDPYIYITGRNHKIYYKDVKYSVSIPDSTIFNNGKILRIINGTWSVDDETTELPSVSSTDNGKILKVTDGNWAKGDAPSGLPEVTAADEGKILEVNSSGEWAKGDAPESIQVGNATGDIVSFNDGADNILMPKLMVDIQPKQDLHGYDSPWVGGGRKNKCPVDKLADGNSNNFTLNAGSYTFSYKLLGSAKYSTSSIILYDSSNNEICALRIYGVSVNSYMDAQFTLSESKTLHISNSNVNVGSGGYSIDNIQIESGSSRTTFAPYSNICPISGWTACNVVRTGKNLFDEANNKTNNKFVNPTLGDISNSNDNWACEFNVPKGCTQFTISPKDFNSAFVCLYDNNGRFIKTLYNVEGGYIDLTNQPSVDKIRWSYTKSVHTFDTDVQIELGNQATTYEAYSGNTYTINFVDGSSPLTVYGGTLDVLSGLLTVDRKTYTLTGSESWRALGTGFGTGTGLSDIGTFDQNKNIAICSHFTKYNTYNWNISNGYFNIADKFIAIRDDTNFDSVEDCVSYMTAQYNNNTPITICAKLATPQTYQLTPTEVKSLLEKNVIYADAGKVTVTYYKHSEALEDMDILFSKLPNVNTTDNNKALLVKDGEWTKAELPETQELFVAKTQQQYDDLPSSKYTDNILYFITDGEIEGLIPTILTEVQYEALTTQQKNDPTKLYFVGGSYICYKGVTYYEQPYVALTQAQYDALPSSKLTDGKMYYITDQDGNELPAVTSSDNGKVLKVVNGAWDKGDAPTELPAVTPLDNGKVLKVINGDWTKSNDVLIVNAVDKSGAAANTLVLDYTYAELLSLIGYGANIMIKYHVPNTNSDEYYHLKRNNTSSTPDWASLIFQVPFVSESNSDEYGNNIIDLSTPEIVIRPLGSTDNPDGYTAKRWPHGDWSNTCARVPLPRTNNLDANRVLSINSSSEIDWDYPINLSLHNTVVGIDYNSHDLKQRIYRNTTQTISEGQHSYTINLGLISGQQQLTVLRLVACCGTITMEETGGDYYLLDLLHDSKFGVRLYSVDLTNAVIEIDVPTGYKLDGGFIAVFQYGCN